MCPTRLLCLRDSGTPAALAGLQVGRVYGAADTRPAAEELAGGLAVAAETWHTLDDVPSAPLRRWLLDGDLDASAPDGPTGQQALARFAEALTDIAERHRGQTVVLVCGPGILSLGLAALCSGLAPRLVHDRPLPAGSVVATEYDGGGWRYLSGWPDEPAPSAPATLPGQLTRAAAELTAMAEIGGESALVAGVWCAALGIPQPWATYARPVDTPTPDEFARIRDWLAARSTQWTIRVSGRDVTAPVYRDLRTVQVLPAYVLAAPDALDATPEVAGLEVGPARGPAEFHSVCGSELAPLITDQHFADARHHFLIGRLDGEPVACAQLRSGGGTVCVSMINVVSAYRCRGIGTTISTAASRLGLTLAGDGPVWLNANENSARIYRRIGYRWVDDHVILAPAG